MSQLRITQRRLVLPSQDEDGLENGLHVGAVELSDGTTCTPVGMPERETREEAALDTHAVVWDGGGPIYPQRGKS